MSRCSSSGKYKLGTILDHTVYKNTVDIHPGFPKSVHPSIKAKVKDGWTKVDLMKNGYAPIGTDGKQVNLHSVLGQELGPMVEILSSTHKLYHKQLHGLIENGASYSNT